MHRIKWTMAALLACAAAFSPLVRAPYLFDDHSVIENDQAELALAVKEEHLSRDVAIWRGLWRKPRLLRQLSHRIDWLLAGESPTLPHVENILLHMAVALAALGLLLRCGLAPPVAAAAAAVFLLNPVAVESVGIVSHRKELLSALFLLLALRAALADASRFSCSAAALILVAAAGKETALVAPALFAVLAFRASRLAGVAAGARQDACPRLAARAWLRPFALYCVVAALGAVLLRWQIHVGMDFAGGNPAEHGARAGHFAMGASTVAAAGAAIRAFPRNAILLAWPFGHAADPGISLMGGLFSAETLSAAFAIALFVAGLAMLARRGSPAFAPLCWILVSVSPYLNPWLLCNGATAVLADRYLYLASIGFAWFVAMTLFALPRFWRRGALVALLALYGACTFALCRNCSDEVEFWAYAARINPASAMAAHNHAYGLWKERGDVTAAEREFRRMIKLAPDFDYGLCSYAQMHAESGDPDSAFALLRAALLKRPGSMCLHRQAALFGTLFDDSPASTLRHFRIAAELGADDAMFHFAQAEFLKGLLDWKGAAREYGAAAGKSLAFAEEAREARLLLRDPPIPANGAIVVLGDSVPHGTGTDNGEGGGETGLAELLGHAFKDAGQSVAAIDASVPGSTTAHLAGQLANATGELDGRGQKPAMAVILSGHNDAASGATSLDIARGIADFALFCRKQGLAPVIVGPIPVRDDSRRSRKRQERTLGNLDRKLGHFCENAGIAFVSSRQTLGANAPDSATARHFDHRSGNHLSREGMEKLANEVGKTIAGKNIWPIAGKN